MKTPKGWKLETACDEPGVTHDQLWAQVAAQGVVGNASSLVCFGQGSFGELSLTECAKVLKNTANGLNEGDLSAAVIMLSSQAIALNGMFGELARRAALNFGTNIDTSERYMRLALKAQGQCRATLETVCSIKSPPLVFARQANINNGGQQQVNNGEKRARTEPITQTAENTRAEKYGFPQNELLEEATNVHTQLDHRAKATASGNNQKMESVEEVNRT